MITFFSFTLFAADFWPLTKLICTLHFCAKQFGLHLCPVFPRVRFSEVWSVNWISKSYDNGWFVWRHTAPVMLCYHDTSASPSIFITLKPCGDDKKKHPNVMFRNLTCVSQTELCWKISKQRGRNFHRRYDFSALSRTSQRISIVKISCVVVIGHLHHHLQLWGKSFCAVLL